MFRKHSLVIGHMYIFSINQDLQKCIKHKKWMNNENHNIAVMIIVQCNGTILLLCIIGIFDGEISMHQRVPVFHSHSYLIYRCE